MFTVVSSEQRGDRMRKDGDLCNEKQTFPIIRRWFWHIHWFSIGLSHHSTHLLIKTP